MSKKKTSSPLDSSAEQRFVRLFIQKSRKDRLLYELTTPEKRYDGISRFCHQTKELLAASKVLHIPLLDHLVIGSPESGTGFVSLRQVGIVKFAE